MVTKNKQTSFNLKVIFWFPCFEAAQEQLSQRDFHFCQSTFTSVKTTDKDFEVAVLYMVSQLHGKTLRDCSNGSHLLATTITTRLFLRFHSCKSPVCLQKQSQQIYYNGIKALDQTGYRGCRDVMSHQWAPFISYMSAIQKGQRYENNALGSDE